MKRHVKRLVRKAGYELRRIDAPRPAERLTGFGPDVAFSVLRGLGFAPQHIVDVGANRGKWTRAAVRYFPDAHYTLIEPQAWLRDNSQDLFDAGHKVRWISAGAGDAPGELNFTMLDRVDSRSFAISSDDARAGGHEQVRIPVRTLNEMLTSDDSFPVAPDVVKIDAEGFDLRVLDGASDFVGKVELFALEVLVGAKDYDNRVLTVMNRMAADGYDLFDITDLNRSPRHGVLWLCEMVFLRRGSSLMDGITTYE